MKTIMITAPSSNTGKTIITLGIIRALKNRGIDVSAFKIGPDFIDRKYIGLASGKRAGNLDIHLMGKAGIWESLYMNPGDFGVIEGAMGYFDGIFNTFENSSYDISKQLDIPSILIYIPKGEMFSAIPKIKGMVDFSKYRIEGIILNKTNESMYQLLKTKIEEYIGISVLGYLPLDDSLKIESRYLGLLMPEENLELEEIINNVANMVEKTIDMYKIITISKEIKIKSIEYPDKRKINVAIAYDDAFNFYYEENIKLFENVCNVEYFSPLKDKKIPDADLIYIGGGYPELYAKQLSNNLEMIKSIKSYVDKGGYLYGEVGGLMYLVDNIEDFPMSGIFNGKATMTDKLQRFGFVNIELNKDTILGKAGDKITGQEFHKSIIETSDEEILNITKPMSKKNWKCGYSYKNTLGLYQHINFLGNMKAFNFLIERIDKDRGGIVVIKNPMEIENKSMKIIDEVMGDTLFNQEEMIIAKRMIHTTGDFDYRKIIVFKNDFIFQAKKSIIQGTRIFTDTKMAYTGINKPALARANCELKCFIDDERVFKLSKELETTRSACAVDLAVEEGIDIFVIGNAPTALYRVLELVKEGKLNPRFIVGVPVGFVGAAESKEYLRKFDIPSISTVGNKGGSNVAASIINALLYMVVGR